MECEQGGGDAYLKERFKVNRCHLASELTSGSQDQKAMARDDGSLDDVGLIHGCQRFNRA